MKIKISLREFILIIFALALLAFVGYKYYEWSTLQALSSLYNQTWDQELGLVQQENNNSNTFYTLFKKVTAKNAPKDALLNSYGELSGDLQFAITAHQDYVTALIQNQNAYTNINTFFLIGPRGDFARKVIKDQEEYYTHEIDDANISTASYWLSYNLITSFKDMAVVRSFSKEIGQNVTANVPTYFSDLSPIQHYTNSDFQFSHASDIKKYYPDGYAALQKYQNFFSNFYATSQDFDTGDTQSAAYTYPSLQQASSDLAFSIPDLLSQENDHLNNNANTIIQLVSSQSKDIEEFESQKLFRYPLLPNISNFDTNLVLCQLYDFKASVYHGTTGNYVKAKTPSELINELSSIPPSTQNIDGSFDKTTMKILNNDTELQFTCLNRDNNTSYQFTAIK